MQVISILGRNSHFNAQRLTLGNHIHQSLPCTDHPARREDAEANHGARVIVLLLPESAIGGKPQGADLRGLAMLKLSESETGSFRGHIDAVLVDRRHRRQGGAKALVAALEYEAARRGRSLLVGSASALIRAGVLTGCQLVDTESGSVAEAAFKRLGYVEIGKIPHFSRALPNGKKGETFFYKEFLP
ncbi:MAG: GNAT family N-acetyltransferase, partial [Novosphingobium sp.]